jgi:hydrogenase-1 operon protein HyaF
MKAGFWVAPEGEGAITMLPIGAEAAGPARSATLGTADAAAMIAHCPRVAALLPEVAAVLEAAGMEPRSRLFDIIDWTEDERRLIGHVLGTGEVSATVALPDGVVAQIQESVLAGLWRVRFENSGAGILGDYIEVGDVPEAVRQAARLTAPEIPIGEVPDGAMNVKPLLAELRDRVARYRPGDPPHVVNFSLFPMTEADMAFLQRTLGTGPVMMVSRGYGSCRVLSTGVRHLWSVQYFNAMDTIILDTLEVAGIPESVLAAAEDFADSAERLREIHAAYFA